MLGLLGVARRAGARPGRPPRRHAAGVQGGRRGAVRPRPGQGRLRHRDAGAGHQHAGPLRGAGAAGQVQRRGARRPDPGGVHPAHRPGRPPRHRRRGPRGGGVVARRSTRGTWPGSPRPAPTRCGPASGRRTTWPSTWSARSARTRARELLESLVRPVPGRPVGGRAGPAGAAQRRDDRGVRRGRCACHHGDFDEYFALRVAIADRERALARQGQPQRRAAAVDVAGAAAGRRRDPGAAGPPRRPGRRPRPGHRRVRRAAAAGAHPGPVGRAGRRRPTSPRRSRCWPGSGCPSTSTTARRQARRDLAARCVSAHRPGPARRGAGRPRPRGAGDDRELAAAARSSCASTPATAARTARSTPAGPSAGSGCSATPRRCASKVASRTGSLARTFDRVCALLDRRAATSPATARSPTPAGCWPGSGPRPTCWSPSACAAACGTAWRRTSWPAAVSVVLYEARREADERASVPRGPVADAIDATAEALGRARGRRGGPRPGR